MNVTSPKEALSINPGVINPGRTRSQKFTDNGYSAISKRASPIQQAGVLFSCQIN